MDYINIVLAAFFNSYTYLQTLSNDSALLSPATNDKISGIITMLCVSGGALLLLMIVTIIIKYKKK